MRAIVQERYGPIDAVALREVARPKPGRDEVLVRVRAASVNRADLMLVAGEPYLMRAAFGLRRPRLAIRGQDVAGTVEAVGDGAARFRPGDEVYAEVAAGGFADYVAVPERSLAAKPARLTFEQAAAIPLAGTTALQGLRDVGGLRPGQRVLVHGATGGVGSFAVQIAKALGAEVTGVCGARHVELVRSLGADRAIDRDREDFAAEGPRYDLILDVAGGRTLAACRRALNPGGTLVLVSGAGGRVFGPLGRMLRALALAPFVRQRLRVLAASPSGADLAELTRLVESGLVAPVVDATYALEETPAALRHLAVARARGKVVVRT